jgi:hypothetical protein
VVFLTRTLLQLDCNSERIYSKCKRFDVKLAVVKSKQECWVLRPMGELEGGFVLKGAPLPRTDRPRLFRGQ